MNKKRSRIIASIMAIIAIAFAWYAMKNPKAAESLSTKSNISLMEIYLVVMVILFIAPFENDKKVD